MQIKTTMRHHFLLVRMAIIIKSTNKFWRGCGEKGIHPCVFLVGMQISAGTLESSMELPQKLKRNCLMTHQYTQRNPKH